MGMYPVPSFAASFSNLQLTFPFFKVVDAISFGKNF